MDLGECNRYHDLALRADYEKAAKHKDYGYDVDNKLNYGFTRTAIYLAEALILHAFQHLESFVADADKKTEAAKKRLAETQEELSAEVGTKLNKVHELAEQIGKKLAAAELAGAEGNVEESLKLMEEVEKIKKEKGGAEVEYRNSMPASSYQQQKLRVCEVCSAYLGIHDNDRRLADHFGGKLHLGFITIRERLEELRQLVTEKKNRGAVEEREDCDRYGNNRYNRNDRNDRNRGERDQRERYDDRRRRRNLGNGIKTVNEDAVRGLDLRAITRDSGHALDLEIAEEEEIRMRGTKEMKETIEIETSEHRLNVKTNSLMSIH
ncbi:unnamed protein product [Oppiella nova]|uniref:Uncharacterized protein n=1 Tax=Oppiella nova TaxID=334625 RepID=A0A7R9QWC0_9ACAR|nr:unnamed protein product [Oppiella nova]CAG2176388.1 unnamed protein product [Oppiella nova]